MIFTLTGLNRFMLSEALNSHIAAYKQKYGDIGLERAHCAERTYTQLVDSVQALPFLVPRSLVMLDTPSANKELSEKIKDFINLINDQIDVIFIESKFDKRSSLYKTLKKVTDYSEYNELDEQGLIRWLIEYVQDQQGTITAVDARYLVNRIGADQLRLSNETQKLLAYSSRITRDSIELLSEQTPTSSTFDLLEAALRGNRRKAIALYVQQRAQKIEPQAILALLAWQLSVLAIVKAGGARAPSEIARDAKLNPYVVQKSLSLASTLTMSDIKELIARTLELDIQLKSQSLDPDEAIQNLLFSLVK